MPQNFKKLVEGGCGEYGFLEAHAAHANSGDANDDPIRGSVMWLGLFTPALIAFEAICLASIEHGGRHWKQLFAMPIPRWRIFAVKMLFCGLLVGASFIIFVVASIAGVLLFSWCRSLHLAASTPWTGMLLTGFRTYLACWLVIVIQTWLSVRFPGFAVPAGVAFAATLIGILLVNVSPNVFGWWYPWTLPSMPDRKGSTIRIIHLHPPCSADS